MPDSTAGKQLSSDRVQFDDSLSAREIDSLAQNPQIRVIQTSRPVGSKTWTELNSRFFAIRPEVQLRLFGFYSDTCDLGFLRAMDKVQHFSADCLRTVQHIDAIARMPALRSLGVGVYELDDFGFLSDLPKDLQAIYLGATRSRKPSLRPLERFKGLKTLSIDGQRKDIEVIGSLPELEDVTLRSVTVKDLSILRPLSKMWSLDIKLGGSSDLTALAGMNHIKYLELWQIRGLTDLGAISSLTGLQYLFLQSLPQVVALPGLSKLQHLRRIHLENMKGLRNVAALCDAPALEELIHIDARGREPDDYLSLLRHRNLKAARVGFGSDAKNKAFRALLDKHGKKWLEFMPFAFAN